MEKMKLYLKYAHNKWKSINFWTRTVENLSAAHENALRLNDAAIRLLQSSFTCERCVGKLVSMLV